MDFSDIPHFRLIKILLSMMGVWPYQKSVSRYFIGGLVILVLIISLTPLYWFTLYKTISIGDLDAAIKVIPSYTLMAASQAKMLNLFFGKKDFKRLLEIIKCDWENMSNKKDRQVLINYITFGRKIIFSYCVYGYASLLIFGISATSPKILNIIFPLPENRPIYDLFYIEYFVDKEKYALVYTLHTLIGCFMVITIAVANDSLEFIFIQHACMKLKILGHRIRNMQEKGQHKLNIIRSGPKCNTQKVKEAETEENISESIVLCIQEHNKIIEFANLIQLNYSKMLSFLIVDTVLGFFITGFQAVTNFDHPPVLLKNGTLFIGKLIHNYVQNWIGQTLIDHSYLLTDSIYKSPWPGMTNKERKLLLMMLLRSHKPCKITAGVLCTMSIETFKKMLMMSMSYFTALKSLY